MRKRTQFLSIPPSSGSWISTGLGRLKQSSFHFFNFLFRILLREASKIRVTNHPGSGSLVCLQYHSMASSKTPTEKLVTSLPSEEIALQKNDGGFSFFLETWKLSILIHLFEQLIEHIFPWRKLLFQAYASLSSGTVTSEAAVPRARNDCKGLSSLSHISNVAWEPMLKLEWLTVC